MPICELGYRSWEGRRVSSLWRWLAITRSHVGIAYRSSALLRRFLFLAWAPLLYFAPVFFAVGFVADADNDLTQGGLLSEIALEIFPRPFLEQLRENPQVVLPATWAIAFYFFFALSQSFLAMITVAIVAPPLIAKDLRSKAFLLYLSKPIGAWEYLLGKLAVVLFFVFVTTLFPALLLYAISVGLSPDFGTVIATAPIIARIFVAALAIAVPVSMVALLLSALTKEHRIATFAWIGLWIFGEISYRVIAFGVTDTADARGASWAFLASMREVAATATAGIFDLRGHFAAVLEQMRAGGLEVDEMVSRLVRQVGDGDAVNPAFAEAVGVGPATAILPSTVALGFLAGITVLCAVAIMRCISRPVRV